VLEVRASGFAGEDSGEIVSSASLDISNALVD